MNKEIYLPMSCLVLTAGHIKVLEELRHMGWVTVGLLNNNALKGYKKGGLPFAQRKYILDTIAMAIGGVEIVEQDSLDPSDNIRKHKCTYLASGDGFEPVELAAIKKYKLGKIDIKLRGEKGKQKLYSASTYIK